MKLILSFQIPNSIPKNIFKKLLLNQNEIKVFKN